MRPTEENYADWRRMADEADRILIGAGAGMSVAAGINYNDQKAFAARYPAMVKLGFRNNYDLMGYRDWEPELAWGYLAAHVHHVRFQTGAQPVYQRLRKLIGDKPHFVLTSNVDGQFAKAGFSESSIFTPQGDYARLQCLKPCSQETEPILPVLQRLLPVINPATQRVTDSSLLPRCSRCGGDVFMNVRGGSWFVEAPYAKQSSAFRKWVSQSLSESLLVIEIGAGFNTPGVIRFPMEALVKFHPRAWLLRVNPQVPLVPAHLKNKAWSIKTDANSFLDSMTQEPVFVG